MNETDLKNKSLKSNDDSENVQSKNKIKFFPKVVERIKNSKIYKDFSNKKNENYIYNYAKMEIDDLFEIYYQLTFGFYDLDYVDDHKIKYLSKFVKNEVTEVGGEFYEFFEEISNLEEEIYKMECEYNKNDKTFDVDKSIRYKIADTYDYLLSRISKKMFMYGLMYGRNEEKYLNDYFNKNSNN